MILLSLSAQYIKMPLDTNHQWHEYCEYFTIGSGPITHQLRVKKDSVVNGLTYKLLSAGNSLCIPQNYNPILLRQDTLQRRVILLTNNQEKILYNFDKNVGDTAQLFCLYSGTQTFTLNVKDSVLLNDGFYHKRFNFGGSGPGNIIEGVGGTGGLLSPWCNTFNTYRSLVCLVERNTASVIYSNPQSSLDCSISVGISSHDLLSEGITVFPNPAENFITITVKDRIPESVEIVDCLGKSIMVVSGGESKSRLIDVTQLHSGVYFVKAKSDNQLLISIWVKN